MTSVVSPPASALSTTCGESQCTCGSTPPGVTTIPVASTTAVAVSRTTSTPSIVSGLPARPIATIRPPDTPRLAYRTPRTGSATSPPTIAISTPPRSARTPRPSRIVLPKPGRIRSGPPQSSPSGISHRSESATRTRSGTAVPPLARQRQRRLQRALGVQRTVRQAAVPADHARPAERQQEHRARHLGVEEDLLPGRDRQPHAPGRRAVEVQRAVDLEEVEVRRDADRHGTLIDDGQRGLPREPVDPDLLLGRRAGGGDRVVQDQQPAAVAEQRLDLHPLDERGDAVGHVARSERAIADRLGFRVGTPVAGRLADLVGDQRDGFGLGEREAAVAP